MTQAYERECLDITFPNEGTVTEYGPVKLSANGVQDCGAGEEATGIAQNAGRSGYVTAIRVRILGISKVRAAGMIAANAKIQPAGNGKVTTATALDSVWNGAAVNPCGQLLMTAAGGNNAIVEALILPRYYGT